MTEIRRMRPLLGTFVEVGARGAAASDALVSAAFAAMQDIHDVASFQQADSALSRLNRQPGVWQELPFSLLMILRLARAMTQRSERLFNCTLGGALVARGALPDHGGPEALALGDESDIEIRGRQVRLRRPVRITLDGIAKGFAIDRAIRIMRDGGATAGWVNAGGDLRVFGDMQLAVQRREADESLSVLGQLRDAAVATSVWRPQFDARYPALLLAAGRNRDEVAQAWTVLARRAWRADALTKVAALAPASERRQRVEALGGVLLGAPLELLD